MNKYDIDSTYRQFYVADASIEEDAPDDWTDKHIKQHYYAKENIVALVTEGDITARLFCFSPKEQNTIHEKSGFSIETKINVPSGRLGIYEWPWEKLEEHAIPSGETTIRFKGFNLENANSEKDYYSIEVISA